MHDILYIGPYQTKVFELVCRNVNIHVNFSLVTKLNRHNYSMIDVFFSTMLKASHDMI